MLRAACAAAWLRPHLLPSPACRPFAADEGLFFATVGAAVAVALRRPAAGGGSARARTPGAAAASPSGPGALPALVRKTARLELREDAAEEDTWLSRRLPAAWRRDGAAHQQHSPALDGAPPQAPGADGGA